MWSGGASGGNGIRFCNGAVSVSEKIAAGAWTLELSACWLFGSLQLLPQCCFCFDAILVFMGFFLTFPELPILSILFYVFDIGCI